MYWSLRRELWENRLLYLAPLIVGAAVVVGFIIATLTLPSRLRAAAGDPAKQQAILVGTYSVAPAPVMLTTFLVGFLYCLDALYGERRDGSILFWKSQPVSDRTTVLAKASVPLLVLPLIGFVLGWLTQIAVLLVTTAGLVASGLGAGLLWANLPLFEQPVVMLYGMIVHALWFAPIYGWSLMVSAWARRAPLVWAVVPLLAIAAVERIALGATVVSSTLWHRVTGATAEAFTIGQDAAVLRLAQLDPVRFSRSPDLWVGILLAVLFVSTAMWLRHRQEPI